MAIKWIEKDAYIYEDPLVRSEYRLQGSAALGMCIVLSNIRVKGAAKPPDDSESSENLARIIGHIGSEIIKIRHPSSLAIIWNGKIAFTWSAPDVRQQSL
jgi:hypothetical protein